MFKKPQRHRLASGAASVITPLMVAAAIASAQAPSYTFTTFDIPGAGAGGTTPNSNNQNGSVTGWYQDTSDVFHGFLRNP